MNIKGFCKRLWNGFTDRVSSESNAAADKVDSALNEHYPLSARFFRKLGMTPQSILNEGKDAVNYLAEKSQHLLNGLRDAGKGFFGVVTTFIPFLPSRTSIWGVMVNKNLQKDVFRSVKRNIFFIFSATALLKWPEYMYKSFARSRQGNEEQDNTLGPGFYSLFILNIIMIYKFLKYKQLVSQLKNFLVEDMLDTAVINDKTSKLAINRFTIPLKGMSENERIALLDPRPKAIKDVVRTKIFTTIETSIKDYFVMLILLLNQLLLGSKFVALGGWLLRARIIGKDLGTSQLAASGITQTHLRRIQGHRNFQFLGEGVAYLGMDELSRTLFYLLSGLTNTPLYNFPINVALSCLAYKIAILSTYMKRMDIKESDWDQEGVNLDSIYRPLLVDPVLDFAASRIEHRFKKVREAERCEVKMKSENFSVMGSLKAKEKDFWDGLLQKKLSQAEREFLHLHAENLIFFLSAFKQSRSNGVEYCIKFLALLFPKRVQEIMRIGLEELTDDRIDNMIKFLLINKKSGLISNSKGEQDKWIAVENTIVSPKKVQLDCENAEEEVEAFDITPKEIAAIHYAVAKTLACHNSGIIDIRKIEELDNPEQVLQAEVDCQYDSIADENETRDIVSPVQSPLDRLSEKFSLPVRQFIHNYRIARDTGMSRAQVIVDTVSEGVSAMSEKIDQHIIGGTTTLRVAGGLASSALGAPVAIGITAAVAVADHASSIKAGAAVVGNIVDGLSRDPLPASSLDAGAGTGLVSPASSPVSSPSEGDEKETYYLQQVTHQFKNYVSGTTSYYLNKFWPEETDLGNRIKND